MNGQAGSGLAVAGEGLAEYPHRAERLPMIATASPGEESGPVLSPAQLSDV